jgi:hypothetical protein
MNLVQTTSVTESGDPLVGDSTESVKEGEEEDNMNLDSGTESVANTSESVANSTQETDTISAAMVVMQDFDFEVEVFDWENFERDIESIDNMDFSEFF